MGPGPVPGWGGGFPVSPHPHLLSICPLFCVRLSLLIAMPWARNARGHLPESVLLEATPTDISLTRANVVVGQALVVLIMITRHTSVTTISEL